MLHIFQIIREIGADAQAPAGAAAAHAGQRSEMAGVLLLEALKQRGNDYYRGLRIRCGVYVVLRGSEDEGGETTGTETLGETGEWWTV